MVLGYILLNNFYMKAIGSMINIKEKDASFMIMEIIIKGNSIREYSMDLVHLKYIMEHCMRENGLMD